MEIIYNVDVLWKAGIGSGLGTVKNTNKQITSLQSAYSRMENSKAAKAAFQPEEICNSNITSFF